MPDVFSTMSDQQLLLQPKPEEREEAAGVCSWLQLEQQVESVFVIQIHERVRQRSY